MRCAASWGQEAHPTIVGILPSKHGGFTIKHRAFEVAGSITNGCQQLFFHHPAMGEMKRWLKIIRKGSIYKRTGSLQETFLKITCFKVFFAPVRQRFCAIAGLHK
jgi:hypothetical protein